MLVVFNEDIQKGVGGIPRVCVGGGKVVLWLFLGKLVYSDEVRSCSGELPFTQPASKGDIGEVKAMKTPPAGVILT